MVQHSLWLYLIHLHSQYEKYPNTLQAYSLILHITSFEALSVPHYTMGYHQSWRKKCSMKIIAFITIDLWTNQSIHKNCPRSGKLGVDKNKKSMLVAVWWALLIMMKMCINVKPRFSIHTQKSRQALLKA